MDNILFFAVLTMIIGLFFFFLRIRKGGTILFYVFYFLFFLVFLSGYIATKKGDSFSDYIYASAVLYFFVFLIAIPPTVYSIVKGYYFSYLGLNFERHAYIPLGIFILNTFCFSYLYFGSGKLSQTSILTQNVMTYINFSVVLFLFPLMVLFYSYRSLKIILNENKKMKIKFYKSLPLLFNVLFLLFIVCLFLSQIKLTPFSPTIFFLYTTVFFTLTGLIFFKFHKTNSQEDLILEDILISEEIVRDINDVLIKKLEEDKLFLIPNLTITLLAKELQTNTKYLSHVINEVHGVNFSTFINLYKVEEAKKLLQQRETENFTIETIAKMAGFYSKSSFNLVFKKHTGLTPSLFKRKTLL